MNSGLRASGRSSASADDAFTNRRTGPAPRLPSC